jgi:hypothetical protein
MISLVAFYSFLQEEPVEGISCLLYNKLAICKNQRGFPLYIFLDKMCLNDGKNWQEGFIRGLLNSSIIILLISSKVCASIIGYLSFIITYKCIINV